MPSNKRNWLLAIGLSLPMVAFFVCHYLNHSGDLTATGFIQYDNVSYMAYARQYLDADHFSLFYSNPLSDSDASPAIYFHPQTLLLALFLKLGLPPGLALCLFVWMFTVISFRLVICLYDLLQPHGRYRFLSILFFSWGGGLLVMSGAVAQFFLPKGDLDFLDRAFALDPGWGWWGLSFGRSLFFSMEAFYHALFVAAIVGIIKQKWLWALGLALLLSLSHPFTGIEFLCIAAAWVFTEKILFRNKKMPGYFAAGIIFLAAGHAWYYLVYLNGFPEHRIVSEQYALNWRYRFYNFIPAYAIVAFLAGLAIRISPSVKQFLANSQTRLFGCWALVAFALANHEMFMKPMQPLHFTRGYVWTGLFLLGLPALQWCYDFLAKKQWGKKALIIASVVFLSDNALWVFNYCRFTIKDASATHITAPQQALLNWLGKNTTNKTLIIGKEEDMNYLATVYSPAYSWYSHPFTTPSYAQKKQSLLEGYAQKGIVPLAWRNRPVLFVVQKKADDFFHQLTAQLGNANKPVWENDVYMVIAKSF
jgi:hypothetical protein